MQIVISIDIGGTTTKIGLVHQETGLLNTAVITSKGYASPKDFFSLLFAQIENLLDNLSIPYTLLGIGIGAPSCNNKKGIIEGAANIAFLNQEPITTYLQNRFNVPTFLIKDSNAAALGEHQFGAAKGMNNFILLTIGTGLGCGIVVNGKVLQGTTGKASEFGHIQAKKGGRQCGCGAKGCLETYASATGIKRTAFKLLADYQEESPLRTYNYHQVTAKLIYELAKTGDTIARKVFQVTGKKLGQQLADLITLFEPEAIFLAGGVAKAGSLLLAPITKSIKQNITPIYHSNINVQLTALAENEAALLGAASLVWTQHTLLDIFRKESRV